MITVVSRDIFKINKSKHSTTPITSVTLHDVAITFSLDNNGLLLVNEVKVH